MLAHFHSGNHHTGSHTVGTSYCAHFAEQMEDLYLLSVALTADHEKAEQCFVAAMGECVDRGDPSREWVRPVARWSIITHALRFIMPSPDRDESSERRHPRETAVTARGNPLAGILSLEPFERFVFVLSVLEGCSDGECARTLRCSLTEVKTARIYAITTLATSDMAIHSDELLPV